MVLKRTWVVTVIALAFVLVAALAVAAFLSSKQTATSSFTAASVGEVDIGDAETVALFNASGITPGYTAERCFVAHVRPSSAGEEWKLYSGLPLDGGLAEYMQLTIERSRVEHTGTAGVADCASFVHQATLANATVAAYASLAAGYAGGAPLGVPTPGADNYVMVRISMELPNTADVIANATGSLQTSWIVENR